MPSKLLLIEDVDDLGKSGDVVSVKPGYARNFLIPQKKAIVADKRALHMQSRLQEERKKRAIVDRKEAEELASKLTAVTLSVVVKVDQEGHMFGSVAAVDVVKLLEDQNIKIERRMVRLTHPIKETGVHKIVLRLKEEIPAEITLKVIPDNAKFAHVDAEAVPPGTPPVA